MSASIIVVTNPRTMAPIILALLLHTSTFSSLSAPADPPNILVSSLEPFELPVGVIVTTYDDRANLIGIQNLTLSKLEAAVFDQNGVRVSYLQLDGSDHMDLKNLPEGNYILRVVDQDRNMNMYRIRRNG